MPFETEADTLKWYEGEDRIVNDTFVAQIPWHEVKNHPVDTALLPVLVYMRDLIQRRRKKESVS